MTTRHPSTSTLRARLAAVLAIACMVFATTSVPRLATAENDRVALVVGNRATQTWLAELGYEVGPADGLAGPSTQTAIVRFAEDRGVAPAPADSPDLIAQLAPLVSR